MIKKIWGSLLAVVLVVQPSVASADVPKDIPAVRIVAGSDINLLATDAKIPVSIKNDFNTDLRIQVHAAASNGRLSIPAVVEVTVPANTAINAQIPVKAIGSGEVDLAVWLETFSGLRVGDLVQLHVNVNADAETLILISFGIVIVLLGTFGAIRTIRKRRQKIA